MRRDRGVGYLSHAPASREIWSTNFTIKKKCKVFTFYSLSLISISMVPVIWEENV